MKYIYLSLFLFINSLIDSASAQSKENISIRAGRYNSLMKSGSSNNSPEFLNYLIQHNLLDIHLFNKSYLQGINTFIFFKQNFHDALGRSDIPDDTSPLAYLLNVIKEYEKAGNYHVAFLYYDATGIDELAEFQQADSSGLFDPFAQGRPEQERPVPDRNKFVRVWYLSSQNLYKVNTGFTYQQLSDLEKLNRIYLKVTAIAKEKLPRGIAQDTLPESNASVDVNSLLRQSLMPDPVLEVMRNDSINGIIIVPYDVIGQVPFYSLPLSTDSGATLVIDKYSYTIAPHLCNYNNVFLANKHRIGKANKLESKRPLVVGNPDFFNDDKLLLPDLPGAEKEANIVGGLLNTKPYIGERANYDTVLKKMAASDFAYFATHAVPSFDDPASGSFIALTPSKTNFKGFLTIRNIQNISARKIKMVVLSACQTGVGKSYKSGYCNIGRGFFIAGVDNCVMSLWNLDDQNTVSLMTNVIEELKKPQFFYPAENLRQAILKFRATNPSPVYWTSMVNFGICY